MTVELREIAAENRAGVLALAVGPKQREYVAANADSLREAAENPEVARPFALYAGEELVGFTMFAFDPDNEDPDDKYWLWRLMIDEKRQGLGLGRAAMAAILAYFRAHGADTVTLSTKESNGRALALYRDCGFRENGQVNDGEIVLKLRL